MVRFTVLTNYSSKSQQLPPFFLFYDRSARDIPLRRVKRWAFSVEELLLDPAGKDQFSKFLDKEFSGENLK